MKKGRTRRVRCRQSASKRSFVKIVDEVYIQLRSWLKKTANTSWKSLKSLELVMFNDTGRGLITTKHLKEASTMISLPLKVLITTHSILQGYMGSLLKEFGQKLTPVQVLCSYLVFERHKDETAIIQPYIKSLPLEYDNIVNWNDEDLKYLPHLIRGQASNLINEVCQSYKQLQQFLDLVYKEETTLVNSMNYELYLWAWSTVNTRCVYMKQSKHPLLTEDSNTYALAPFLDMLNHSGDVQVNAGYNEASECYEIITNMPVSEYSQAFINYGPHDNIKLLLEYGFILPSNFHNHIKVSLDDIMKSTQAIGQKEEKIRIITENDFHRGMVLSHEGLSWNLEVTLQILAMDLHSLSNWKQLVMEDPLEWQGMQDPEVQRLSLLLIEYMELSVQHEMNTQPQNRRQSMAAQLSQDLMDILKISRSKLV